MDNNKVMYGALITEIDKLGDKHSRNNEPREWLEMQISKKCNKTKQKGNRSQAPTDLVRELSKEMPQQMALPSLLTE